MRLFQKQINKDARVGIARASVASLVVILFGQGMMACLMILLARIMGTDRFGIYVYVLTWLNILVLLSKAGMDTALIRYVASYSVKCDWGHLRGILLHANQIVLAASLLISTACCIIVLTYGTDIQPELKATFLCSFLVVPCLSLSALRQTTLRGLKKVAIAQIPELIIRPLFLIAIVVFIFFFLNISPNSTMVMWSYLAAATITFVIGHYLLKKYLPINVKLTQPIYSRKEWMLVALPMLLISGMHMINTRIDTIMIGILLNTTQAGIYNSASRIASIMLFGVVAANSIIAPTISSLYTQRKMVDLQKILLSVSKVITLSSVVIAALLIYWGDVALSLFGNEFTTGHQALKIITIALLVNTASGPVGLLMTMTNHQSTAAKIFFLSTIMNIVLNLLLIPRLGITGGAMATAFSLMFRDITLSYFVWKRIGLKSSILLALAKE